PANRPVAWHYNGSMRGDAKPSDCSCGRDTAAAGVGRALLTWLISEARRAGYDEMLADTMPMMTMALDMYEGSASSAPAPIQPNPRGAPFFCVYGCVRALEWCGPGFPGGHATIGAITCTAAGLRFAPTSVLIVGGLLHRPVEDFKFAQAE